jgi:uncharacterized caspase-like protein
MRYLQFLIGGAIVLVLSASSAMAEKRIALVVGNSSYQHATKLQNAGNDAEAVGRKLRESGFDLVKVDLNLGNLDFKRELRQFEDAVAGAEVAVVYFAGHGVEISGRNYVIPVDAKLESERDAPDEAVSLDRLVEVVDAASRLRLIIIDACRDNPFSNVKRQRIVAERSVSRGLGRVAPVNTETLIAYAAKAGTVAADGDRDHSPFTTAILTFAWLSVAFATKS